MLLSRTGKPEDLPVAHTCFFHVEVGWLVGWLVFLCLFVSSFPVLPCSLLLLYLCHHSFVFLTILFPLPLLLQLPPYATLEQARKMLGLTIKYGLGTMMFM